jgi:predicted TPR repeat methyltransferase
MNVENEIQRIIKGIGSGTGTTGNVMEILGYTSVDFQKGFDIANEMQNRDLVKLLYSNFNQSKVIIEFTLLGKAAYEKQS